MALMLFLAIRLFVKLLHIVLSHTCLIIAFDGSLQKMCECRPVSASAPKNQVPEVAVFLLLQE